ncbi:hypothetical protein SGFS_100070 [Streptomyces graminofaciens]|uniref:Uncharacterized protein n=1 Tax=Streptomyces graminofaciens TaxID=68212 RepID=A0ABM7FR94_9ACTN|nr:hypothetical protein SGFS_100070 [Streptomyces graminofaciens]
MQLRAVEERQGVHLDVVPAHLAVDRTGDVLGDQAAGGEHRSLGTGLGAAGVDQLRQVVLRDEDILRRRIVVRHPVRDGFPCARRTRPAGRVGHVGRVGGDHAAERDGVRESSVFEGHSGHGQEGVLDDESDGARVVENVGGFLAGQHEVDGYGHRAQPGEGEVEDHVGVVVVAEQGYAVAPRPTPRAARPFAVRLTVSSNSA